MATRGFAAPEVESAYRRAHQLCEALAPTPYLFPVLWGLVRFHNVRAELATSERLGRELLAMAEAEEDAGHGHRMVANLGLGVTLFHRGELLAARHHLESALSLAGSRGAIPQAFLYGVHPDVHVRSYTGYVLWHLGLPDQSLRWSAEALALARKISDPLSLALALNGSAIVHQFRREGEKTQELAAAAIEVAEEGGFPLALAMARTLHGWALAEQDRTPNAAAVERVRQALLDWVATGSGVAQTHFLALLAEIHGRGGEPERGLQVLSRALAIGEGNGERYYLAEIHRLEGELRLAAGASAATAERCFVRACRIARAQRARALELRATCSLAGLLTASGRAAEARRRLAPLVRELTEGAATADLSQARDLLARLVLGSV
jgi:predicted ATPase